jgi:hypothetical protein
VELFFIIILLVAATIAVAVLARQPARRRWMALAAWAASRGLAFDPSRERQMDERYPKFGCLRQGGYAYNVILGHVGGRPISAFDYRWEAAGRARVDFSAVIVGAGVPLKPLVIREGHFFDKAGAFLGFDDIDFESTEFSKAFYVKSPDRRWAFDVIHQATMEFLLASPRFTLEFQGSDVIARREWTFKPEDFEAALAVIEGVLQRLPESLLREMKG